MKFKEAGGLIGSQMKRKLNCTTWYNQRKRMDTNCKWEKCRSWWTGGGGGLVGFPEWFIAGWSERPREFPFPHVRSLIRDSAALQRTTGSARRPIGDKIEKKEVFVFVLEAQTARPCLFWINQQLSYNWGLEYLYRRQADSTNDDNNNSWVSREILFLCAFLQ